MNHCSSENMYTWIHMKTHEVVSWQRDSGKQTSMAIHVYILHSIQTITEYHCRAEDTVKHKQSPMYMLHKRSARTFSEHNYCPQHTPEWSQSYTHQQTRMYSTVQANKLT